MTSALTFYVFRFDVWNLEFPWSLELGIWSFRGEAAVGCLARIRTYSSLVENKALTPADAQIDAHKLRQSAELIEIIKAWPRLPAALKAAVLAIVRS